MMNRNYLKIGLKYTISKLRQKLCKEILVIGDSHASIFKHAKFIKRFPNHFFNVVSVGGATVSGLQNPNSKTQSYEIFLNEYKKSKAKTIIVLLGEVDTGFVIWYRAEKYNESVTTMLNVALKNYQELLSFFTKNSNVICISTPLPTIKDNQSFGGVANARKDIVATQLERTKLTLEFNRKMHYFCNENSIAYVNLDQLSLNTSGCVNEYLLNSDLNDHHYDDLKYADLIIRNMNYYP
jgi:hypothetical protein